MNQVEQAIGVTKLELLGASDVGREQAETSELTVLDEIGIMRNQVDALDEAIINLAAERTIIQARIQAKKVNLGHASVELGRERQIMENVTRHANKKGLDENIARGLIELLIKMPMGRNTDIAAKVGNVAVDNIS